METFRKELEILINKWCMENGSNTPDFMLADYLVSCLENFNMIVSRREDWYQTYREGKEGVGFGWRKEGGGIVEDGWEQGIIRAVAELRAKGFSFRDITNELKALKKKY